eukprot:COSAG02_NODE_1360_length_13055_cov_9.008567_13_plen_126_part_00
MLAGSREEEEWLLSDHSCSIQLSTYMTTIDDSGGRAIMHARAVSYPSAFTASKKSHRQRATAIGHKAPYAWCQTALEVVFESPVLMTMHVEARCCTRARSELMVLEVSATIVANRSWTGILHNRT